MLQLPQCPCGQAREPGSLSTVTGVFPPPNGVSEGGLCRRSFLNPRRTLGVPEASGNPCQATTEMPQQRIGERWANPAALRRENKDSCKR